MPEEGPGEGVVAPTMNAEMMAELRARFPDEVVGKKPVNVAKTGDKRSCNICHGYHRPTSMHLDFVGHADVTDRLNTVDPLWTWMPMAFDADGLPTLTYTTGGEPVGLWIFLTIGGKRMPGYGSVAPGKDAENVVKELIGDAIRNAALRFGVALYLWSKNQLLESSLEDGAGGGAATARDEDLAPEEDREKLRAYFKGMPQGPVRSQAMEAFVKSFGDPMKLHKDALEGAQQWIADHAEAVAQVASDGQERPQEPPSQPQEAGGSENQADQPAASQPAGENVPTDELEETIRARVEAMKPREITEACNTYDLDRSGSKQDRIDRVVAAMLAAESGAPAAAAQLEERVAGQQAEAQAAGEPGFDPPAADQDPPLREGYQQGLRLYIESWPDDAIEALCDWADDHDIDFPMGAMLEAVEQMNLVTAAQLYEAAKDIAENGVPAKEAADA